MESTSELSPLPPPLPGSSVRSRRKRLAMVGIWLGAILSLGPVWGFIGTAIGMLSTFEDITVHGAGNANELSKGISASLRSTEIGILITPFGLSVLILSILMFKEQSRREKAANQALQTTPMTRSVFEKTREFDGQSRGV